MHIADDHFNHGAALIQIAEHKKFTAINSIRINRKTLRNTYKINNNIAVYLKYATKPKGIYDEYKFTFFQDHLKELKKLRARYEKIYLVLICVDDREICLLSYDRFLSFLNKRLNAVGYKEDQFLLIVRILKGKSLRVYVNKPKTKGRFLDKELVINRNDFPKNIFI